MLLSIWVRLRVVNRARREVSLPVELPAGQINGRGCRVGAETK
jgi:hypothetical protein